ncbi:hypothetical protein GCM10023220_33750 [Streptomyces ziwulingensis]|uniref:Uncharacterized protein n=1 Tax=Streptomyces ziwulingensis TaxID=1045501 RepID=A0ABP9C2H2_9ACTN
MSAGTDREPVRLMTMRVTRMRDGRVVDQGPEVRITSNTPLDPYAFSSAWPPCQCPRHRE